MSVPDIAYCMRIRLRNVRTGHGTWSHAILCQYRTRPISLQYISTGHGESHYTMSGTSLCHISTGHGVYHYAMPVPDIP
eukprot:3756650-Rhodomonas_salina.6